jgi:hypothetical protein
VPEITYVCGTHRRRTELFWYDGEPRLRHAGSGDKAMCASQRLARREERIVTRDEALAELTAGERP